MIGCGYVGLVTGTYLAELAHNVASNDNDAPKIEAFRSSKLPITLFSFRIRVTRSARASKLPVVSDTGVEQTPFFQTHVAKWAPFLTLSPIPRRFLVSRVEAHRAGCDRRNLRESLHCRTGQSPEIQVRELREYCERRRWNSTAYRLGSWNCSSPRRLHSPSRSKSEGCGCREPSH